MRVSTNFHMFPVIVMAVLRESWGAGTLPTSKDTCMANIKDETIKDRRVCVSRNALNPDFKTGSLDPWMEKSKGDAEWVVEDTTVPSSGPSPPPPSGGNTKILRLRQWDHFDVAVLRSPPFLAEPGDQIALTYWISFNFVGFNNLQVMWVIGENGKEKFLTEIYPDSLQVMDEWRSTVALIPVESPTETSIVIYGFCGTSSEDALAIQSITITSLGSQTTNSPLLTEPATSTQQSLPSETAALSTPSTTTIDPKQECPGFDYSPCSCFDPDAGWGHQINCENVRLIEVHRVLARSNRTCFSHVDITLSPYDNHIPANFSGGKAIDSLKINGSYLKDNDIEIDQLAVEAKRLYFLTVRSCSVARLNLNFLVESVELTDLVFENVSNFEMLFPTLLPLTSLTALRIYATPGLGARKFPAVSFPIEQLDIRDNGDVDDLTASQFLQWLFPQINSLEKLRMQRNSLTRMPLEVTYFPVLYLVDLSGNPIPVLPANSVSLVEPYYVNFTDCGVIDIKPGAFQGLYMQCKVYLMNNRLTRFESNVFKPIMEDMSLAPIDSDTARYVDVDGNPFDCDADICHLSWLLRDNRHLLKFLFNAVCANGIQFENIPVEALAGCP